MCGSRISVEQGRETEVRKLGSMRTRRRMRRVIRGREGWVRGERARWGEESGMRGYRAKGFYGEPVRQGRELRKNDF